VQYIAVDCSNRSRTGDAFCEKHYAFWIDHHGVPDEQADLEYVHPERSACSELVLEIAETLGIPITKQLADLLYTALVTDTNCFRTLSTNAQSFAAAERLTKYGAQPYEVGRKYAMIKQPARLKLESRIFSGMHLLCGGRLVTAVITLADLAEFGISDQNATEMQKINDLLEVIETAQITVMVREYPTENAEGCSRFSVKSTSPQYSAKAIAQHFGGGGHIPAAGGFRSESPETVREMLEAYCAEILG
jgi:phosphoesterase RecJ-like protein